jgi:hypothetical protein
MLSGDDLDVMAEQLVAVAGVVGVTLGGSRARGDATATSDVDVGIYYDNEPDLETLARIASTWCGRDIEVAAPGRWGPWVDGGAWLVVADTPVDWVFREVRRVQTQCERAQRGLFTVHSQVGHPFGFVDIGYAGEIGCARVLADPTGVLGSLHQAMRVVPPALADTLATRLLWEAEFCVLIAGKATARRDVGYIAMCLSRALMAGAYVLHARHGTWVTNEKGLIGAVARLPGAPDGFADRAAHILGHLGTSAAELTTAIDAVAALLADIADRAGRPHH